MATICIKGMDYSHFEKLITNLDERQRIRLLNIVRKMASGELEKETEKIQIIPDDVHIITRMMINRAYEIVKSESAVRTLYR